MGKSPNLCFKIIPCAADSTDVDDDLSPAEGKQSSDKRRWSFRKRSARHQVLSNTVISEPRVVSFDKKKPEATTDKLYPAKDSSVPAKSPVREPGNALSPLASASIEQANSTATLSFAVVNTDVPPVTELVNQAVPFTSAIVNSEERAAAGTCKVTTTIEDNLQEKERVAVVIQASARRFLAQRELQKLKNVVKLQAAVRGHLVRKQAIGTLRCVQAIAKLQILVRVRRARQGQLLEKGVGREMNNEEFQMKKSSDAKSMQVSSTVQKLLSNGFARQLLESAPKSKPVHISCDPLRYDSSWQWLERWMAVTSSKSGQQQELDSSLGYQEEKENINSSHAELDVFPVLGASTLSGPKLSAKDSTAASGEGDSKTGSYVKFESQAPSIVADQCLNFLEEHEKEHSQGEDDICMNAKNFGQTVAGVENPDTGLQFERSDYPNYTDSEVDNLTSTTKTAASDLLETEGKKFDLWSRKSRNPAFAAAQAKFEELSTASKASRSVSISQDAAPESKANHSQIVSVAKNKDFSSIEKSTAQNLVIQVAPSECGTEISISSTLDSPDRSETDGGEIVLEIDTPRGGTHNVDSGASDVFDLDNMKTEAQILSAASVEFKGQRLAADEENTANYVTAVGPVNMDQPPVKTISNGNCNQHENLKEQAYRSSPERSPGNDAPASESHDTPSSQVSIQSRTSKSQNNNPVRKPKPKSGNKSLSSNGKIDSDERSSSEHLPKEEKNANRRSSFGIAKLDLCDNEPRRSSSNSVPSYMQATESAKAKAHGSVSLKSSPDVHDIENHTKKRHSLPMVDEKQGSFPRVQRSVSQTQQSSKRTNSHSPHSSAERRWQR